MLSSTPDSHSAHTSSITPTAQSLEVSRHHTVGRHKYRTERRERLKRYAATVYQALRSRGTVDETVPETGDGALGPTEVPQTT